MTIIFTMLVSSCLSKHASEGTNNPELSRVFAVAGRKTLHIRPIHASPLLFFLSRGEGEKFFQTHLYIDKCFLC